MSRLNVNRLAEALSEILSDRHGVKVTVTFNPREQQVTDAMTSAMRDYMKRKEAINHE